MAGRRESVAAGTSGDFDPTEYFYSSITGLLEKVRYHAGMAYDDAEYFYDGLARLEKIEDWLGGNGLRYVDCVLAESPPADDGRKDAATGGRLSSAAGEEPSEKKQLPVCSRRLWYSAFIEQQKKYLTVQAPYASLQSDAPRWASALHHRPAKKKAGGKDKVQKEVQGE